MRSNSFRTRTPRVTTPVRPDRRSGRDAQRVVAPPPSQGETTQEPEPIAGSVAGADRPVDDTETRVAADTDAERSAADPALPAAASD
jgi:hypothetical protein